MCSKKLLFLLHCGILLSIVFAGTKTGYYRRRWLRAGDTCLETGRCVDFRRCPTYHLDLLENQQPTICSYKGDIPIICCFTCFLYNMTFALKINEKANKILGKTGVRHFDKCTQNFNKLEYKCKPVLYPKSAIIDLIPDSKCFKIVYNAVLPAGGEEAKRSEYPHMALLGYGEDQQSAEWKCGGSLISERYILTAAHCSSDRFLGSVKFVALGMLKRSDPVHLWDIYNVDEFIPHPDYVPPNKYHDIALIRLVREVNFHESVMPACLVGNDKVNEYHVKSQEAAWATGWGALGHRSATADVLQKVDLQEFTDLECAVQYPPGRNLRSGYNHTTQMCYGHRSMPRDTCGGDSGGPLQVQSSRFNCLHMVIGVTSYGGACGFTGSAGIYTRVSNYVPWIEDIVWP